MKVDKYILCMPKAIKWATTKLKLTASPSMGQLQILYAIRRLGLSTNATIIQYLRKMQNIAPENIVSNNLKALRELELVEQGEAGYSLSPSGREFLSLIRRYLVNVRL